MFFLTLMVGTMIAISSYSWMGMWMGLEINLLSMMPLMSDYKSPYSTESSLKYFIIQALASMILMFSIISTSLVSSFFFETEILMIMNLALMIKMGMAPFHFWFPEIIDGLNWMNCLILLTWQKIAPMMLIILNTANLKFINSMIIISLITGGLMGLNQSSLRKIMVYSSINHMGWMMAALMVNELIWWTYIFVYTLISFLMISFFKQNKIFKLNQIQSLKNSNTKMVILMNFLSLGGLPPFIGFIPKWLTINELISNNFMFTAFMAAVLTLITLYFYTRIFFPVMTLNKKSINLNLSTSKNWIYSISNSVNLLSLPICTIMAWIL
uniref:NADH-ubiquinone oxidoreductase chain 2 n=1 Tax=Niptus hololeucus TaxID=1588567 RepID=A0A343C500_9COLE|nr:NADH dehydrogenase subunit 2 [Niptus hololeucus]